MNVVFVVVTIVLAPMNAAYQMVITHLVQIVPEH
jgi:hypothetical protein